MLGLSAKAKEALSEVIENLFDAIALNLLGNIPKLKNKKFLAISGQPNLGLANLFVQAMGNKTPNAQEEQLLTGILNSAYGYVESLKNKTTSNISERIDGFVREASFRKENVLGADIQAILDEEMKKAKSSMLTISESEATKFRNLGSLINITRVAADLGDQDPTVFFSVLKDAATCQECIRIHLMPDRVTPRLYKFSELKHSYHRRGDDSPSVFNLHPHCRCTLTYLSPSYSFDKFGKFKYVGSDHDEYALQRA
jgi:hypothetical protein